MLVSILSICPDEEVEGDDDEGEGKKKKQTNIKNSTKHTN